MMPASNQGVGMNMGFPDVCATPTPAGPVPIPYPNIGMNATALPFCPNIFVSFVPGHNMGAKPLMTNGDNAGVAHPLCMQPGGTTMGNPKILLSGLPAEHMLVPTNGNNFNDPVGAKLVPSVTNVLLCALSAVGVRGAPGARAGARAGAAPTGLTELSAAGLRRWTPAELELCARELGDLPAPSLGLTTTPAPVGLRVIHVRRDELAAQSGVRRGDLLLTIDGRSTTDLAELPRPEPGREVQLGVERDGVPLTFAARWVASPPALTGQLLDGGVGLLTLRRFSLGVAALLDTELERLERAGARALILDLRGNPGGALSAACEVASRFLPPGALLARSASPGAPDLLHRAGADAAEGELWRTSLPSVVLIDEQTASAGEVLAAALQDHARAPVLGRPSFGKGRGETPAGLRVSLLRGSGAPLHGVGVRPDLLLTLSSPADELGAALRIAREAQARIEAPRG